MMRWLEMIVCEAIRETRTNGLVQSQQTPAEDCPDPE